MALQTNRTRARGWLIGVVTLAVVAGQMPAGGVASADAGATGPSCVSLTQWEDYADQWWNPVALDWNRARATNGCSSTVRIKLIWSWVNDTGCYSIGPGRSLDSGRHTQMRAEVTGVERC